MTNEQKAKELCDCDNCKACSKFAEEGAAYALTSTCDSFDVLMQTMKWKDEQYNEEKIDLLGLVKMLKIDEQNQTIIEDLVAILNS